VAQREREWHHSIAVRSILHLYIKGSGPVRKKTRLQI
jgi:hypothetical protein